MKQCTYILNLPLHCIYFNEIPPAAVKCELAHLDFHLFKVKTMGGGELICLAMQVPEKLHAKPSYYHYFSTLQQVCPQSATKLR